MLLCESRAETTDMLGLLKGIFGGGGMSAIENIASEWIETDKEKAEAQAVMIKTLDPNGLMRRELSRKVAFLYSWYIFVMLALLTLEFFGFVPDGRTLDDIAKVTDKVVDLFVPISTLFGIIVSASFGVNYANTKAGK